MRQTHKSRTILLIINCYY